MKIDEIQCIKELRNGSYQAFTQIYEAYADRLYSFVLKQLKNRSLTQDIVQDTFLRLWDNRNQLNSFGNLQAFIFTIAKHQVIDYFRKQVNELQFEDFMEYCENQATDVSPEDILLYDEFLQQLQQSKVLFQLSRMTKRQKILQMTLLTLLRRALQKKMLLTSLQLLRSTSTIRASVPMKLRIRAHFVISLMHSLQMPAWT